MNRVRHPLPKVGGAFAVWMLVGAVLLVDGAWGQSGATPAPGSGIAPEVLRKVKRATVRLKVAQASGRTSEGSGFFATEPGVVLTNAHVLGMFKFDSRRPLKVEATLHGGEREEKTLPAQVLGVDTNSDLAVLRVAGDDLPRPLDVAEAGGLVETQVVYVFGYPFGASLGNAITVNTSSVSSLRRNKAGVLEKLQVNGGMNPGNSGGPVVDGQGRVVGVAVSGIGQTQINFAVPGEAVRTMLAGKVQEITLGYPYKDGDDVKTAIDLRLIDPLRKVGKVSLLIWPGKNAKTRAEAPPPPPAGDRRRFEAADVAVKQAVASVTAALPPAAEGEVYWVQPSYTDGAGRPQKWLPIAWPVKAPVERTPVVLALKHEPRHKDNLELVSDSTFTLRDYQGEEHTLVVSLKAGMVEEIEKVDGRGIADIHLKYSRISMGAKLDNQAIPRDKQTQKLLPDLFKVGADLRIDAQGTLVENKLKLAAVPRASRELVSGIATKIQQSFEAVELPMPGRLTEVNAPWTGRRSLPIDTPGEDELGVIDMKYTYLGHRRRNGVDEALIDMKGQVKGNKGNGLNLGGRVQGLAVVDLARGEPTQVNVTTYLDLDITLSNRPGKANGKLEVRLARKPATAPAGAPATKGAAPAPKEAPPAATDEAP